MLTLISVGFFGVRFEVEGGGVKLLFLPRLKLVRIMLETLAHNYTNM